MARFHPPGESVYLSGRNGAIVKQVLFVCTGNICRSPLAEELLRRELERRGLSGEFIVDSVGTDPDHIGEPTDTRMRKTATGHGVRIDHRARRLQRSDLDRSDLVIGMDEYHMERLRRMVDGETPALHKLGEFDPQARGPLAPDVPDPWYGGMEDFEQAYRMIERTIPGLADYLAARSQQP